MPTDHCDGDNSPIRLPSSQVILVCDKLTKFNQHAISIPTWKPYFFDAFQVKRRGKTVLQSVAVLEFVSVHNIFVCRHR